MKAKENPCVTCKRQWYVDRRTHCGSSCKLLAEYEAALKEEQKERVMRLVGLYTAEALEYDEFVERFHEEIHRRLGTMTPGGTGPEPRW